MRRKYLKLPIIFCALFGMLFGAFLFSSTPVFAVPENGDTSEVVDDDSSPTEDTEEDTNENTEDTTESTSENTENQEINCYSQTAEMSWFVCSSTKVISGAVDAIYGIISGFLVIQPISTDTQSPIYIVWNYARDITNIIFIIFILVIVYSQITGIGINNYGIKKTLPRIIIAAVLVNLSYVICSVAVDISNIIGGTLVGFFQTVADNAIAGSELDTSFSWGTVALTILGGGAITLLGISATGGFGALLWVLIPIVLCGFISVIIGLIMIALRQALVIILVMVSPLAFVAYLLPNTSNLFKKWKDLFTTMLVFYPMFSVLFGASYLAGWIIIGSAQNTFWVLMGMAVQVLPLVLTVPLMKASGTFLDKAGDFLNKAQGSLSAPIKGYSDSRKQLKRAQHTAKSLKKPVSIKDAIQTKRLPSAAGFFAVSKAMEDATRQKNEEAAQSMINQHLDSRAMGKRIIGFNKQTGKAYYSQKPIKENDFMRANYASRVARSNAENTRAKYENTMSTMGTYLKQNNIQDKRMRALADQQADNYLTSETLKTAARRNDLSDKRFYFQTVQKAAERKADGTLKNPDDYHRFIENGAGADFFVDPTLTGSARQEAESLKFNATTSVVADAYSMIENERKANIGKYTVYLDKQVSKEVDKVYDQMLSSKNIDGIVAAQNITAKRGDYDKIASKLNEYMNQKGYVELNTDFANTLALNLLSMKNASPDLGRLGKHINVETWRYTNGDRSSDYVTMQEFFTGVDSDGGKTKFNAQTLLQGTSFKEIDRTFFNGLNNNIYEHLSAQNYNGTAAEAQQARNLIFHNMVPGLISAVGTFSSGSEQIVNTMGFITGAKFDSRKPKGQEWYMDNKLNSEQLADLKIRTSEYMNALTTENVINMKTDTFNALITQLSYQNGGDKNIAIDEFRKIFENKGILDDINSIKATNPSSISGMRPGIRKALGI